MLINSLSFLHMLIFWEGGKPQYPKKNHQSTEEICYPSPITLVSNYASLISSATEHFTSLFICVDQSNSGYLRSIHNCVFYAICVLEKLFRYCKNCVLYTAGSFLKWVLKSRDGGNWFPVPLLLYFNSFSSVKLDLKKYTYCSFINWKLVSKN